MCLKRLRLQWAVGGGPWARGHPGERGAGGPGGAGEIQRRGGHRAVGGASVVSALASAHRHEEIAACEYAIDRVKQLAPIWKKEAYADGEVWIGAEAAYQSLPDRKL